MEFFKNIAISLHATGPAAVMIVWLICVTTLGLFGNNSKNSNSAMVFLGVVGGALMTSLGNKPRE